MMCISSKYFAILDIIGFCELAEPSLPAKLATPGNANRNLPGFYTVTSTSGGINTANTQALSE